MDIDLSSEPVGLDMSCKPVYLREIWPSPEEIRETMARTVTSETFSRAYEDLFEGDEQWKSIKVPTGDAYHWNAESTYIKRPPYFDEMVDPETSVGDIVAMRPLALLGDSVTTDHISPAGSIAVDSPAGKYLISLGVKPSDFNSYGSRRGNHEVMVRGTLANIRLRNQLAPGSEGGWTVHQPSGEQMSIYDAAMLYKEEGAPLLIIAGKEYGSGSSRDWAAKGVQLLGVRAVLAESFERIHRSNLVGMGVLPLEFLPGENHEKLGLTGKEVFALEGVKEGMLTTKRVTVRAVSEGGETVFAAAVRVDTPMEAEYYRNGGILAYVLRQLAASAVASA
jgi:aconitate hydratase